MVLASGNSGSGIRVTQWLFGDGKSDNLGTRSVHPNSASLLRSRCEMKASLGLNGFGVVPDISIGADRLRVHGLHRQSLHFALFPRLSEISPVVRCRDIFQVQSHTQASKKIGRHVHHRDDGHVLEHPVTEISNLQ